MSTSIAWFRRNLRLTDNAALLAAATSDSPILPVYISDDLDTGGAARWWLHDSLDALGGDIAAAGGQLACFRGAPERILPELARKVGANAVFAPRRLDPGAAHQEASVESALDGVSSIEFFDDSLLRKPREVRTGSGSAYKVFTPYYRASSGIGDPPAPIPLPSSTAWYVEEVGAQTLKELKLRPDQPDWAGGLRETWQPGEAAACARLDDMADKIRGYASGRDLPAEDATSRLSPHLHFGEISPRQVWHGIMSHARSTGLDEAAEPFIRQLYWRDFSAYLLHHNPDMPTKPLRDEFKAFPWHDDDEALKAWQRGRTGYPIVDAGMRQLWHSGWMHNRVRMIVASLLVKHLLIPWQRGYDWFMDTLVDADTGNNAAGWQWVAGCGSDAAPYFRIFNPISQGQKFDPKGDYVRRWVPELRELPTSFIHEPWTADDFTLKTSNIELGIDYPRPIVEHKAGRQRALDAYQAMRAG